MIRPGWNEAAHTDAEVLHAAVYCEFKDHVEDLLRRGRRAEAIRLWASPNPVGLGVEGLPPFRRAPCMVEGCRRCAEFQGGFKFPWLGTWNSTAVLALPGSDPRRAWQSYYDRLGQAKFDLLLLEPLRTQWTARDFAPDNIFGLVAFLEHNEDSMVDMAELWGSLADLADAETSLGTLPWCRFRRIWSRGGHHGPGQSDPCGAGWEPWRQGRNPCHHAELVEYPHQSCALDVSPQFAVPAPRPNVQVVTPLYVLGLPRLLRHDVTLCCMRSEVDSAVFSPSRRFLVLVAATSAAAMAYHPGVYAVQAAEAEEESFSADTAMERVAGFRVSQWREQWGLLDEADFAFAFSSCGAWRTPCGRCVVAGSDSTDG